jgi:hypothetical protein
MATIETIPCVFVQKESLLAGMEAGVTVPEALVVVDPRFIDVEGVALVGVLLTLEDETPLILPGDEVSCGEDEAL